MQSILIVDDIAENLYYLEVLLQGNGFDVRTATNGAEALELARQNPPDLILTDILMPVMDGYALCREWRSDARLCKIPFVFYTATFTDRKDEELALNLGADRFVIKPLDPETLMGIVREVLSSSRRGAEVPSTSLPAQEMELLKDYNEALFRKLEKKMRDLEQANAELQQKMAEQKRLEEQLRQVQKMEAIGRFSAGIAHDFNNILTVITGFSTIVQMNMASDDPEREKIDHILAAANRAKNLTRNLLTFSRKQDLKLEPLSLNDCVRKVESFLRRIIGEDINLILSLTEERVTIFADNGHIEQVLMNLATNARDSMPNGGDLCIGTEVIDFDEEFIKMHGYGTLGKYAVLTVADTGIGMDETTKQHIFEPFFTTKERGQGTGLGLSITYGIVHQHKGNISVCSEPDHGTTFKIFLPLLEQQENSCEKTGRQPMPGGTETILVVDDEPAIRDYLRLLLTNLGYTVLFAQDGQEAVDIYRERKQSIDLVLMDLSMPIKNGSEAAHEMRALKTGTKLVFTSGYPADFLDERKLPAKGEPLLMKPLLPAQLAVSLRAVLDADANDPVSSGN